MHLVDTRSYNSEQIIRMNERDNLTPSEVSGVTFSPDGTHMFAGVLVTIDCINSLKMTCAATLSRLYDYRMDLLSRRIFPSGSLI